MTDRKQKDRRCGFRLSLPDDVLRQLSRAEYYAVQSWLRHCRRMIALELETQALRKFTKDIDSHQDKH